MKRIALILLFGFAMASVACNQCGERRRLFNRSKSETPAPCPSGLPVSMGTGYGNPVMGYPTGGSSAPIYTGPSFPTYPSGDPIPTGGGSPSELPAPGAYIPSPGVPSNPYAQPRSLDSNKSVPKVGGLTTGDTKK
jgi:hypothetical protein